MAERNIDELMQTDSEDESNDATRSIKKQLISVFNAVGKQAGGSFALSREAANAPNPGLYVPGIGTVGMPISAHDAAALAKASHQAPFGLGSETIVDTSVRNSWELNASQFELRNPKWTPFVNGLATDISKGLGIAEAKDTMKIELYKLLLYEKGAFFNKHREYHAFDDLLEKVSWADRTVVLKRLKGCSLHSLLRYHRSTRGVR